MKKTTILFFFSLISLFCLSQNLTRKVLFLGNSYTYVNDLPLLVAALAQSAGDSLIFDDNCPGGYTLGWQPIAHATDPISLGKIGTGVWDWVVLQEQSQIPAIPVLRDSCMKPAALILRDSIVNSNSCSRLLFYLTWGRRFGGIQCWEPNYCSTNFSGFDQMQDSLTWSYRQIASLTGGSIAPVGEAWRLVLHNSAMVLHATDFSHPNINGSYLAACVFFSSIFHKPSAGLSFTAGLLPDTAFFLQHAADSIVFGYSSTWNLEMKDPTADFETSISSDTLKTLNLSLNATSWKWDFGDGTTSTEYEPSHVYSAPGNYRVSLVACDSCHCDSVMNSISIQLTGTREFPDDLSGIKITQTGPNVIRVWSVEKGGLLVFSGLTGRILYSNYLSAGKEIFVRIPDRISLWSFYPDHEKPRNGKVINIP